MEKLFVGHRPNKSYLGTSNKNLTPHTFNFKKNQRTKEKIKEQKIKRENVNNQTTTQLLLSNFTIFHFFHRCNSCFCISEMNSNYGKPNPQKSSSVSLNNFNFDLDLGIGSNRSKSLKDQKNPNHSYSNSYSTRC
jgi:hypothetical protein